MMVSKATDPVTAMRPTAGQDSQPGVPAAPRAATMIPMALHEIGGEATAQSPPTHLTRAQPAPEETALVDAVEVYHRTYTTILRSSGETQLRVFEHSHKAMGSSLHPLAGSAEIDLGAFLYAIRRLPEAIHSARIVVMGQSAEVFAQRGYRPFSEWTEVSAPGRRRRWYDDGDGTLAVLIASASDVDDLIPTMVALQIEWKKLRLALRGSGMEHIEQASPAEVATACGGLEDDWLQLHEIWGVSFGPRLAEIAERPMALRMRMLGGTQVGYARVTRRWWQQVTGLMRSESLLDRPVYFVSSNSHAIANLVTGRRSSTRRRARRSRGARGLRRAPRGVAALSRRHRAGHTGTTSSTTSRASGCVCSPTPSALRCAARNAKRAR